MNAASLLIRVSLHRVPRTHIRVLQLAYVVFDK